MNAETESAIARDLDACDLGLALTKGATRKRYAKHRKACFKAIREMNVADGVADLSDAELLRQLET